MSSSVLPPFSSLLGLSNLTGMDDHGLGERLKTLGIFDDARELSNHLHGE